MIFNEYYGKTTSEYLATPKGRYGRYLWRKRKGESFYSFNTEPKSKKSMKIHEKADFQREINKHMIERSKKSYRKKIIAKFSINPSANNPPHIHTAMKNLLDLFGKPLQESGIKRKALVFNDDKQIVYLSAKYHLGREKPGIHASFYPFRYFVDDLNLANDILNGKFDDYYSRGSFMRDIRELEDDENYDYEDVDLDYKRLVINKDEYIQLLGEVTFKKMLQLNRMQMQDDFLNFSRLRIKDVYLLYHSAGLMQQSRLGLGLEQFEEWARAQSNSLLKWITNSPIKIKLPHIPITDGETKTFKIAVKKKLNEYKNKYKILQPLYSPVALEAIYKPPIASEGFYKDLDNIMRLILPIFNDEFKPPPSFLSLYNTEDIQDQDMITRIQRQSQLLPKSIKYSVTKYEIFEIPRNKNDHEEGFLSIGITGGISSMDTLWDRIDNVIRKWEEHWDRHY